MINEEILTKELATIFNQHNVDNALNTPDFLLAEYVVNVLKAYEQTHLTTQEWHKHDDELTTSEIEERSGELHDDLPPYEPSPGMKWEKEYYVCDQGHYGGYIWRQVRETPVNTIMSLSDIDGSLR